MIREPRNLLWIIPLLLLLTSPLWEPPLADFLAPHGGYDPQFSAKGPNTPIQNFTMDSVSITLTSKGMAEWQIDADQAFTGERDNEIEMTGVRAMYIGTKRDPTNIQSERGRYLVEARELVLLDNVLVAKPTKKEELRTEELHYFDDSKMAVCPGKVSIQTPDFKLNAGSMDYDLSTDGFDFQNRVKVDL